MIVASDPALRDQSGRIITADINVPEEGLEDGPRGHRVQVIDYDATTGTLFAPWSRKYRNPERAHSVASFNRRILHDPQFHQQNVYAVAMRTLAQFEAALGRRVSWSFGQHQLKIAPHAFVEANAFYSAAHEGVVFGYFKNADRDTVFTCLSHDIVAHETTHALLDGLQPRYKEASQADQVAFHEGFADTVALLSAFSLKEVLRASVAKALRKARTASVWKISELTLERLKEGVLFGLGDQYGIALGIHGSALRRSVRLKPNSRLLKTAEFQEPHRRGEILVAAVLHGMLGAYQQRLSSLGKDSNGQLPAMRVAEEGADIASHLLTMAIRAIDYLPPADVTFNDFLSAVVTADIEHHPDDSRYQLRRELIDSFKAFGILPASNRTHDGRWEPPDFRKRGLKLHYGLTHFDSLQRHRDEVFRFLWLNRKALDLSLQAHTQVLSVDPSLRIDRDGFVVRETIANYVQILLLRADELGQIVPVKPNHLQRKERIVPPPGMHPFQRVKLMGGGALIFNEYGRLKYHVHNSILDIDRQNARLRELWGLGYFSGKMRVAPSFAALHRHGASGEFPAATHQRQVW